VNANEAPDGDPSLHLVPPDARGAPKADATATPTDEPTSGRRTDERDQAAIELMVRVARGDEQAFEALFRLFSPTVLGIVRRVLRDPAQSEEVTQEVFVEVWRTATRFDGERGSAASYIATLAHRRAVDRVRSEQAHTNRQDRVAAENTVIELDQVEGPVLDDAETELVGRRVRGALETLTELQREAIELAYYRGYSYPQVAQLLDVPLGTVKTRIRDGMIRLRDQLGVNA
jgi:RNA polymerase sigma-70 factor (ECF subfamily)